MIIHQVFHDWRNESMPLDWDELRQTCIGLNEEWEYKVPPPHVDRKDANSFLVVDRSDVTRILINLLSVVLEHL